MPGTAKRPRLLADTTPLRVSADYRRLWIGQVFANVGAQLAVVAVGLQVYDLTGSSAAVGLVGLAALVPLVVLGLYGGALVDAHDRRTVALLASLGLWVCALGFVLQAWLGLDSVGLLYLLVAVQSAAFAVNSPARSAIIPRLLPAHLLPAANALSTLSWNVGFTAGPLAAGFLVAHLGYGLTYTVDAVTLGVALWSLHRLPPLPPLGPVRRAGLGSVLEGFGFLRTRPNVRMTFLVDLAAMVLASPRALFPAVGALVLGGGATTVGVLFTAVAVGSILAGVFSGPLGAVRRQGAVTCAAVAVWGVCIALLGLVLATAPPVPPDGSVTPAVWLAALALAGAGAADAVSAVFRTTILQSATPDALRGRLQGVFIVVVAGGPRLGDAVLGALGEQVGEAVACVAGGLACVVAVLMLARLQSGFLRYDAKHPVP